jgi:hypothetical protein
VAAIGKKDPAKVQELLKQGSRSKLPLSTGTEIPGIPSPVLFLAAKVGDAAIVQMLVDKGADVKQKA